MNPQLSGFWPVSGRAFQPGGGRAPGGRRPGKGEGKGKQRVSALSISSVLSKERFVAVYWLHVQRLFHWFGHWLLCPLLNHLFAFGCCMGLRTGSLRYCLSWLSCFCMVARSVYTTRNLHPRNGEEGMPDFLGLETGSTCDT